MGARNCFPQTPPIILSLHSQGNSTFAAFHLSGNNEFLGSFAVKASDNIDAVEGTDGIDIANVPLSKQFTSGLLVVQDGSNEPAVVSPDPEDKEIQNFNTNFKYVGLEEVAEALPKAAGEEPTGLTPLFPSRFPTQNSLWQA